MIKKGPKMTCFLSFVDTSFDQKGPFFSIKIFSLFHQHFLLFLIMGSVDHISFPSAGTGPLHIKGTRSAQVYPDKFVSQLFSPNRDGAKAHALWPSGQIRALCTES